MTAFEGRMKIFSTVPGSTVDSRQSTRRARGQTVKFLVSIKKRLTPRFDPIEYRTEEIRRADEVNPASKLSKISGRRAELQE